MKAKRFLGLVAIIAMMAMLLTGCGYETVYDGETGILVRDGVAQKLLEPGRHATDDDGREKIVVINNKFQTASSNSIIEAQSKDGIIINASGFEVSYRILGGEKSLWFYKNVGAEYELPSSLIESALKDALLEVDADNATKRTFVEPIFKRILQERIDEHFGYHDGADSTVVEIRTASIRNLSPEKAYDEEMSRVALQKKIAENDQAQREEELKNVEDQITLAKLDMEKQTAGWDEITDKFTPEVAAYLIIEKWNGECYPGSPIEQVVELYIKDALEDSDG